MEIRANVYSPLQNTAVWLGAWLYELVPHEDVIDAFVDLGGPHTFGDGGLLDMLRTLKELTSTLIDALPPERREALILTQVLGYTYEEAAKIADVRVGTIRSRVARARADLIAATATGDSSAEDGKSAQG